VIETVESNKRMGSIRIGDYFEKPDVNYEQPPLFTWKDFYNFRNHVLQVLRRFGSAGPMGEVDLSIETDDEPSFGSDHVDEPDFFVVDDMYNEHNRLSMVECNPSHITADLISSLSEMAGNFPGWWVSFSLGDSGLFVTSETVLLGGRRFWDCNSVQEIGDRCAKFVDFGPSEPFSESMYHLWLAVISGRFNSQTEIPPAPSRQWLEVIGSLQKMLKNRQDGHMRSNDYDQVRNDLHPNTRREFILRLLGEISEFPADQLTASLRNIQKDSGQAFLEANSMEVKISLATRISSGLVALAAKLDASEIVSWWANVLHGIGEPSEELAQLLNSGMRSGLRHTNPLVQLSSIFGLARLHAQDIASIVSRASSANPEWSTNAALVDWLRKLSAGSTLHPDRRMLKSI
jgi:hypothetical protein